jgi:hypothetical protein
MTTSTGANMARTGKSVNAEYMNDAAGFTGILSRSPRGQLLLAFFIRSFIVETTFLIKEKVNGQRKRTNLYR